MIASLRGKLASKDTDSVIVDVGGIGYRLFVSLRTYAEMPDLGQEVSFKVHMAVRTDAIELFGFLTGAEREAFVALLSVAGIGPKLARNILSGIAPADLADAIAEGDQVRLNAVPGVGKRTAERIIVELKDKTLRFMPGEREAKPVEGIPEGEDGAWQDVLAALLSLGLKKPEASRVMLKARDSVEGPLTVQSWLKESLRLMAK